MDLSTYIILTFLLGIVPPLFWLWFWLREDAHPEPKNEVIIVFLAGMGAVVLALVLEGNFFTINNISRSLFGYSADTMLFINVFGFALIEEFLKMGAAFFTALRSKYFDEPVDAMVYMVTAALGFASLENVLFIAGSLKDGVPQSVIISSFRFINAVLLHISASAIIGSAFAFSFFHKERRIKEIFFGLIAATVLHALYNFFIIGNIMAFGLMWTQFGATLLVTLGAFIALILFERARRTSLADSSRTSIARQAQEML